MNDWTGKAKTFIGAGGEQAAVDYLEKKGYRILKQNYRTCGVEIDLVAQKNDIVCFIEVKTRGTEDFGLPEEYVDFRKRKRIIRGARVFLAKKAYADARVRFDIISVVYQGRHPTINHIEDAFEA